MDIGTCPKLHAEEWKIKYEESEDKFRFDSILEQELMSYISDADKRIKVIFILTSYSHGLIYWILFPLLSAHNSELACGLRKTNQMDPTILKHIQTCYDFKQKQIVSQQRQRLRGMKVKSTKLR